jgi:hypothetical protein
MSVGRIHLSYYSNSIGFYVKTMSAHGSHLGWRSWSSDTNLKVYYPRTIHAMFALYWLTGFRGEDCKTFFPIGSYVKTMSAEGQWSFPCLYHPSFSSIYFSGVRVAQSLAFCVMVDRLLVGFVWFYL